jgi:nitrous oxide reductase accessory protein NosL
MKKLIFALLSLSVTITFANAEMKCQTGKCGASMKSAKMSKKMPKMFQSVSKDKATIMQSGDSKLFCPECGMTLHMFYKTNHLAKVDGKIKQYCSIHCLVDDMKKGSKVTDIKVVDIHSLKFIDAKKAIYVVGSKKKGTMTMVSKYAFASKVDAEHFAKENGGEVVTFDEAIKRAESDFAKDSTMIGKKQKMMSHKGEAIYGKKCKKSDKKFTTVAQAKAFITTNKLCKDLNGKELQAVGLYLKNR